VLALVGAGFIALFGLAALAAFLVVRADIADAPQLPSREALWSIRRSPGMTFLDKFGQVIATRGAKYGQPVTLKDLPPYVPKAFLAAEDRRFYQHGPLDFKAIARAAWADLRKQRSAQGASTLTQQLARTLFLKREQSLKRKVQEAFLAWSLEQNLSKTEILELYMNRTYFGAGAYGLDAASETYFGHPARQLTLAEAATLAGLPNAPSRLALTNDMPAALARARHVLGVMREEGWVSDAELTVALNDKPVLAPAHTGEGDDSYILDQAAAQASQLTQGQTPDLVVSTTIDPTLEAAGVAAVRDAVEKEGARRAVSQGALVSLAPDGAILAMVGGIDHDTSSFNRVIQARRQPGSSFKAFVYSAAVEHGLTAADVRQDAPITLGNWTPENYGHGYAGAVTLQQALARSLNTVSVRLTMEVGPDAVAELARRFGLGDIPAHPGPSIALGAYEVSLLELATGYQVFQTGGGRTTPYLISQVRSTRGDLLYAHAASAPVPVYDPLFATRMVGMLKTVITAGTGTGANIGRPAAGKTGTSQNWRDAWFVGFTPDVLTAVWVGNDDGRPMAKVTGGELPAQIWKRFMMVAERGAPPRDFPWLVAEPTPQPSEILTSAPGGYEDQPPDMNGDAGAPDRGLASVDGATQDGPDADQSADPDQSQPDFEDRRAPPDDRAARRNRADRADRYDPADRYDRRSRADDDPPADRYPPADGDWRNGRGADGPQSPADESPRYRY
jgi:penicillin-binding protein 1A